MSRTRLPFLAPSLGLLAACAATADAVITDTTPRAPVARASWSDPAPEASAAPVPAAPSVVTVPLLEDEPRGASREHELRIWNDPAFQRQFVESYAAETDIEPRLALPERETMQKVLELMSSDKSEEASKLIVATSTPASSAVFDFTLANLHFQAERLDDAAEAYELAVAKFPKFRRAWRNLALIRVRQAKYADAARSLVRVIELGGGDAITYGLLAYAHTNLGDHVSAESGYRLAALLDPQTVDWKNGLARSFFEQKRYAEASALCDSLLATDPERADLWLLQANAFIGLNQPRRAAENYELVDRIGKSTPESLNTLGDIYVNDELFDLAVDTYERAMRLNPSIGSARAIRAAKALSSRGATGPVRRLVDAIEDVHAGRLTSGERKDLLKLRARMAVAEGAGDEEARVLEEIVVLDPLDGEALILLGQHQARTGDVEKAIFWYERAASVEAFEADAKVRHAQLLVGKGRYTEALPLLRRAQSLKPRENVQQYLDQVERVSQSR